MPRFHIKGWCQTCPREFQILGGLEWTFIRQFRRLEEAEKEMKGLTVDLQQPGAPSSLLTCLTCVSALDSQGQLCFHWPATVWLSVRHTTWTYNRERGQLRGSQHGSVCHWKRMGTVLYAPKTYTYVLFGVILMQHTFYSHMSRVLEKNNKNKIIIHAHPIKRPAARWSQVCRHSVILPQPRPLNDSVRSKMMASATAGDGDETKHPWPHSSQLSNRFQTALAANINRPERRLQRAPAVNAGLRSVHQRTTLTLVLVAYLHQISSLRFYANPPVA